MFKIRYQHNKQFNAMNKLLFTFFALLFSVSVMAQQAGTKTASQNGPKITFQETEYSFGDIQQGQKVEHIFTFKNSGTEPLILSNVKTSCGCTATDWPRDPVAPGASDEIKVVFNSAGKMGRQNKVVTVVSNAVNSQEKVKLVGNVLPKEGESK
jgi:hypothetical protein